MGGTRTSDVKVRGDKVAVTTKGCLSGVKNWRRVWQGGNRMKEEAARFQ